jgi:succinate dehydrogenase / fumarate reductase, membrane anchor subunit
MVTAVTNLGRSGLYDWVVQRATAVILLAYFLFLAAYLIGHPGLSFAEWKGLFSHTWMRVFSMAALLSICAHAWIGLWGVSTDYLTTRLMGAKATSLRLVFQAAYSIVLFSYLVWGIQVLWG